MTDEQNPGRAYQLEMLGLLGDDDPAVVQGQTPELMQRLLAEAGDHVRTRPAPGEFSVAEVLGHMVDAELVGSIRYRWILAEDEPVMPGYEQDDWVRVSGYADADPAEMIDAFTAVRRANLALWRRSPAAARARLGLHSERGPESYELTFRLMAGHDRNHLNQARRAIEAVKAAVAAS